MNLFELEDYDDYVDLNWELVQPDGCIIGSKHKFPRLRCWVMYRFDSPLSQELLQRSHHIYGLTLPEETDTAVFLRLMMGVEANRRKLVVKEL